MAEDKNEKKPSDDKLAKQAIARKYQRDTPIIIRAGFEESKSGYAAITKDHIQLFDYDKSIDDVVSLVTHHISNYDNVAIDHFAIKSIFRFKGIDKTFELTAKEDGKKIESFIKNNTNLETNLIQRKFHNKILGFRSNTKWKMVVAIAVYLFITVATISAIFDKKEEKAASTNVKTSQNDNKSVEKSPKKEEKPKETANKPQDTPVKMDDGRNVNMEIYNKYSVKYQSHEPTTTDKATMEHFEKMAQKYNMSVPEYIEKEHEIVAANVKKAKEEQQKVNEENKKQANAGKPRISKGEFDKIENGMTYDQVKEIIGSDGEVLSESGDKGTEFYTVMYMWKGQGTPGANANFMFQGGKLTNKAQFGLK